MRLPPGSYRFAGDPELLELQITFIDQRQLLDRPKASSRLVEKRAYENMRGVDMASQQVKNCQWPRHRASYLIKRLEGSGWSLQKVPTLADNSGDIEEHETITQANEEFGMLDELGLRLRLINRRAAHCCRCSPAAAVPTDEQQPKRSRDGDKTNRGASLLPGAGGLITSKRATDWALIEWRQQLEKASLAGGDSLGLEVTARKLSSLHLGLESLEPATLAGGLIRQRREMDGQPGDSSRGLLLLGSARQASSAEGNNGERALARANQDDDDLPAALGAGSASRGPRLELMGARLEAGENVRPANCWSRWWRWLWQDHWPCVSSVDGSKSDQAQVGLAKPCNSHAISTTGDPLEARRGRPPLVGQQLNDCNCERYSDLYLGWLVSGKRGISIGSPRPQATGKSTTGLAKPRDTDKSLKETPTKVVSPEAAAAAAAAPVIVGWTDSNDGAGAASAAGSSTNMARAANDDQEGQIGRADGKSQVGTVRAPYDGAAQISDRLAAASAAGSAIAIDNRKATNTSGQSEGQLLAGAPRPSGSIQAPAIRGRTGENSATSSSSTGTNGCWPLHEETLLLLMESYTPQSLAASCTAGESCTAAPGPTVADAKATGASYQSGPSHKPQAALMTPAISDDNDDNDDDDDDDDTVVVETNHLSASEHERAAGSTTAHPQEVKSAASETASTLADSVRRPQAAAASQQEASGLMARRATYDHHEPAQISTHGQQESIWRRRLQQADDDWHNSATSPMNACDKLKADTNGQAGSATICLALITIDPVNRILRVKPDLGELIALEAVSRLPDGLEHANHQRKLAGFHFGPKPTRSLLFELQLADELANSHACRLAQMQLDRAHQLLLRSQSRPLKSGDCFQSPLASDDSHWPIIQVRLMLDFESYLRPLASRRCDGPLNVYVRYRVLARLAKSSRWRLRQLLGSQQRKRKSVVGVKPRPAAADSATVVGQSALGAASSLVSALAIGIAGAGSPASPKLANPSDDGPQNSTSIMGGQQHELCLLEGTTVTSTSDQLGCCAFSCCEQIVFEALVAPEFNHSGQMGSDKMESLDKRLGELANETDINSNDYNGCEPARNHANKSTAAAAATEPMMHVPDKRAEHRDGLKAQRSSRQLVASQRPSESLELSTLPESELQWGNPESVLAKSSSSSTSSSSLLPVGGSQQKNSTRDGAAVIGQQGATSAGQISGTSQKVAAPSDTGDDKTTSTRPLEEPFVDEEPLHASRVALNPDTGDTRPMSKPDKLATTALSTDHDDECEIVVALELYSSDFYQDKVQGWSHWRLPIRLGCPKWAADERICAHSSWAANQTSSRGRNQLEVLQPVLRSSLDRLRYHLIGQMPDWLVPLERFAGSNYRYLLGTQPNGQLVMSHDVSQQFR